MKKTWFLSIFSLFQLAPLLYANEPWQPADSPLMMRWAADVSPENVHREYPRPQMVRDSWTNLNGLWDYAITPRGADCPEKFDGKILVPFPVESALSGVKKRVGAKKCLWYRRTFDAPIDSAGRRTILHFGAVDWETTVWVDGVEILTHRGGYDPFSCDITDAMKRAKAEVEIVVRVWDPTDDGHAPRGKQTKDPRGIWYTPVTGIWQTVWLEQVPETSICNIQMIPDIDRGVLKLKVDPRGPADGCTVEAIAIDEGRPAGEITGKTGQWLELSVATKKLWSPDSPFLYDLKVALKRDGETIDQVDSYFGMRKISKERDCNGILRLYLNNEPLFQFGPLDQGWWPDGLYTAPTDEALRYDLEVTKRLGFNMVRKHVKVEPARWYTHCDRLGLLVWQDMPNGDRNAPWPRHGTEIERTPDSAEQFELELQRLIDTHMNYPCIVMWVPFNEAWGQYDTERILNWAKQYDPSRLVDAPSGGNDFPAGDTYDLHEYPGPAAPPALTDRVVVLGEYGGLGLPLAGHLWQQDKNWGYRGYHSSEELHEAYIELIDRLRPMVEKKLAAAVYTQTTDVEIEINGFMTYDREVLKLDPKRIAAANRSLYGPIEKLDAAERTNLYTVARWRFEEGTPGQLVPHDRDLREGFAAADISGNRNHLFAYSEHNAPKHGSAVPVREIPQTGDLNQGSLDDRAGGDGPTHDLFTDPGRSRSRITLNTYQFSQWTVEASFRPAVLGQDQSIVSKDGQPTDDPAAPFRLGIAGDDDRIVIEAIDRTGTVRRIKSKEPIVVDQWYNVAATSDGQTMKLYVDRCDGEGYQLEEETEFTGRLINSDGTWTVGRGFYDGKLARDARADIDEIRISAKALSPEELLFAVPSGNADLPIGISSSYRDAL